MSGAQKNSRLYLTEKEVIEQQFDSRPYRITPFIITFCEGALTHIDIQNFIEMGLHIVRFRINRAVTRSDKLQLLAMLKKAVQWICEKYEVSTWPIALCLDLPCGCIRTGIVEENLQPKVEVIRDSTVMLTTVKQYWDKCDSTTIFIDDPYTFEKAIQPGTEITLSTGHIVMVCTEVVDKKTVICKVNRGGYLSNFEYVCIRGIKLSKPAITKRDLELIAFAKEFEFDILTLHSVRSPNTLTQIKDLFRDTYEPLLLSSICEQDGLDNIDAIIEKSDGIVLAREFLSHQIVNKNNMTAIQSQISAKCRRKGKPFFISGNILEQTLMEGTVSASDISDVTNAVMQGCGFQFQDYTDPTYILRALKLLNAICRSVESLEQQDEFWRMSMELRLPVNAAEACILACALAVRQSRAVVVILPTVTGQTAIQLSRMAPRATIITISSKSTVAKKLQIYRGIIPIVYSKQPENDWASEMSARINFAVLYGIKKEILKYGNNYVTLRKSEPTSAFCDNVGLWKVVSSEFEKHRVKCNFESDILTQTAYDMDLPI